MATLKVVKNLLRKRLTLARALGEVEIEQLLAHSMPDRAISSTLVAGGGRDSHGSELVVTGVLTISNHPVFIDIDQKKNPSVKADLERVWPFQASTFDLVISTWVAEHLMNPEIFFVEAFRVLKSDGSFVCGVPFLYRKHGSPMDWWRFTDTAISYLANAAGFKHIEIRPVGSTPFIACVSLIWPFIKIQSLGILLFIIAKGLDGLLEMLCKITGKGGDLIHSYPIHYIASMRKG